MPSRFFGTGSNGLAQGFDAAGGGGGPAPGGDVILTWESGTNVYNPILRFSALAPDDAVVLNFSLNADMSAPFDTDTHDPVTAIEAADGQIDFPDIEELPGGETYYAQALVNGVPTNIVSKTLVENTKPILTSPSGVATGETTADLEVTVDEASTVYSVVTQSSTTPTEQQIIDEQDHTGAAAANSDNLLVGAPGVVALFGAGLDAGEGYYAHFTAEDAVGNRAIPVTSAVFVTDAAAGSVVYTIEHDTGEMGSGFSGAPIQTPGDVTLGLGDYSFYVCHNSREFNALTWNGVSAAFVAATDNTLSGQYTITQFDLTINAGNIGDGAGPIIATSGFRNIVRIIVVKRVDSVGAAHDTEKLWGSIFGFSHTPTAALTAPNANGRNIAAIMHNDGAVTWDSGTKILDEVGATFGISFTASCDLDPVATTAGGGAGRTMLATAYNGAP